MKVTDSIGSPSPVKPCVRVNTIDISYLVVLKTILGSEQNNDHVLSVHTTEDLINVKQQTRSVYFLVYWARGGQIAARGPHVTRHSVFSGPRKHSGKIFKSEISFRLSQQMLVLRLPWTETLFYFDRLASICMRRYGPPLDAAFSMWSLRQINCPPLY